MQRAVIKPSLYVSPTCRTVLNSDFELSGYCQTINCHIYHKRHTHKKIAFFCTILEKRKTTLLPLRFNIFMHLRIFFFKFFEVMIG